MDYDERMERAGCFEDFVNHKGFEYIKSYFAIKVQNMTNRLLADDGRTIEEAQKEINELTGVKKLLSFIEEDIDFLNDERNKTVTTK